MVDHAFTSLGLHRVALSVFAFNERAIRAYERVGFTIEGRAREAIWRDGRVVGRAPHERARAGVACGPLAGARRGRGPGTGGGARAGRRASPDAAPWPGRD